MIQKYITDYLYIMLLLAYEESMSSYI